MVRRSSRCTPDCRRSSPSGASFARVARYNSNLRVAVKRGRLSDFDMQGSFRVLLGVNVVERERCGNCGQPTALPTVSTAPTTTADLLYHASQIVLQKATPFSITQGATVLIRLWQSMSSTLWPILLPTYRNCGG